MRRLGSAAALLTFSALAGLASPALAQDVPPAGTGRTDAPTPGAPSGRSDAPTGAPTGRADAPTASAPTGRTDAPVAGPQSDSARLSDLERRLADQQREIESLKRERDARDLKGKPAPEEKGAVREAAEKKPEDAQFEWGFKDGFFVKGTVHDQDFEFRPTARVQLDYRAFPHSSSNDAFGTKAPQDEFLLRRARVGFTGRFGVFGFDIEADPTRNSSTQMLLGDCWFQYQQFPELVIRLGHFKAPFGIEDGFTSDNYTDFVERSMIEGSGAQLAPDFHIGAMVYGTFGAEKFGQGFFQYYLACQNQSANNVVGSGDPMTTARLASEFAGLEIGAAGRWENRSGVPDAKATPTPTQQSFSGQTPGQYTFFSPVLVRGWSQAYEVDVSYYHGPFWVKGMYGYASQERWRVLADHSNGSAMITQGAYVNLGYMFWAPSKALAHPLVPFKDWQLFNMDAEKSKTRNVGAELVTQLQWVRFDDARGGRAGQNGVPAQPSTAANADNVKGNDCKAVGLGLNIYPIENVKFSADWFHLRIGDQSRAERAHSRFADEFLFRAQLEF